MCAFATTHEEEARTRADLMRGPLNDFVAARSERVRDLRKRGEHELAARIAALRKPSVAVWALNQAGAVAAADLEAVRSAGELLRQAQADVLNGNRDAAQRMRRAAQDQRRTIDALTRRLGMMLSAAGHAASDETSRRVSGGLRNASTGDDETWEALREGRLTSEPEPASFPIMEVTRAETVADERAALQAREHRRQLEAAEADVHRAEERERTAREQEAAARQRRDAAAAALAEARDVLSKLRG